MCSPGSSVRSGGSHGRTEESQVRDTIRERETGNVFMHCVHSPLTVIFLGWISDDA